MKPKTIVGCVLLLGFGGLLFMNFGSQVGGYMTFKEATASGAQAHVVGTWAKQKPTHYDRARNVFTFYMRDKKGNLHKVRYANPMPANFTEATQLVVQGYARDDAFAAEHILVKCPSKYNGTGKRLQQTSTSR
ncbi:cytochrome c maturation protein CcmE domain-containing protein [Salisaeta longa]|uniref:cytochrome c maturation protein CcmE domain-containing protein n=1 Tax=Salisaeta longa TaxID=503170 RepID=UPI0003B6D7B6|nr:cytochrome c maturation protein CcmE [Salisaeta longa]